MKKHVYVVFGSAGEYEDKREWPVVAYQTESAAKKHVELANQKVKEFCDNSKGKYKDYCEYEEAFAQYMKGIDDSEDIGFDYRLGGYTGNHYSYKEVPIEQCKCTNGTNNYIRIIVDTNDADYAEKLTPITTEQIEQFKPLIQAIKGFKEYTVKTDDGGKWTHWHNFPVGELYRNDLNEKRPEKMYVESGVVSQDCLDDFYEFLPRADFHSIKTIEVVEVTSVNKLL